MSFLNGLDKLFGMRDNNPTARSGDGPRITSIGPSGIVIDEDGHKPQDAFQRKVFGQLLGYVPEGAGRQTRTINFGDDISSDFLQGARGTLNFGDTGGGAFNGTLEQLMSLDPAMLSAAIGDGRQTVSRGPVVANREQMQNPLMQQLLNSVQVGDNGTNVPIPQAKPTPPTATANAGHEGHQHPHNVEEQLMQAAMQQKPENLHNSSINATPNAPQQKPKHLGAEGHEFDGMNPDGSPSSAEDTIYNVHGLFPNQQAYNEYLQQTGKRSEGQQGMDALRTNPELINGLLELQEENPDAFGLVMEHLLQGNNRPNNVI